MDRPTSAATRTDTARQAGALHTPRVPPSSLSPLGPSGRCFINDLATETVLQILEELSGDNAALAAVGRTQRGWTSLAKSLLWRDIRLRNNRQAKYFLHTLRNVDSIPVIHTLRIGCGFRDSIGPLPTASTVEKILEIVDGMQRLELCGYKEEDQLGFHCLCLPNLRSLKSLSIRNSGLVYWSRKAIDQNRAPFILDYLDLDGYASTCPHLYSFFSTPNSITQLRITRIEWSLLLPYELNDLSTFIQFISPSLISLELRSPNPIHPRFAERFSTFFALRELAVTGSSAQLPNLLALVPSSLKSLSISFVDLPVLADAVNALRSICELRCTVELAELMVDVTVVPELLQTENSDLKFRNHVLGQALLENLESRGVRVEFWKAFYSFFVGAGVFAKRVNTP